MKPSGLIAGSKPPPDIIIAQLVDNQQVALLFYINADFQNASTLLEVSLPSAWKTVPPFGTHSSTRLERTVPQAWNAGFHTLGAQGSTRLERRVPDTCKNPGTLVRGLSSCVSGSSAHPSFQTSNPVIQAWPDCCHEQSGHAVITVYDIMCRPERKGFSAYI